LPLVGLGEEFDLGLEVVSGVLSLGPVGAFFLLADRWEENGFIESNNLLLLLAAVVLYLL
jgi:hypothetical protein